MSENLIVLDLLEENRISFDDALQLLRAITSQSKVEVIPQRSEVDGEQEIKVNLIFKGKSYV